MTSTQFVSDLHLETPKSYDIFEITPNAPYLALIGDIGCIKDDEYLSFLENQLSIFELVFLVLGNHESYHNSWKATKAKMRDFSNKMQIRSARESGFGSFIILDQTRFDLSTSVTILGCTLFSSILPSQSESVSFGLNDFYYIEDWTVEQHTQQHDSDLQWLNTQVKSIEEQEPHRKIIVLTHYSPTTASQAVDPKHGKSALSSGFSTDLSNEKCWTSASVKVWAFGHTHFNCDFEDLRTGKRVVTNQRGYHFYQAEGFEEGKVIEVD